MAALLPLFPLDVVLLPGAPLPLHIFEPRYKEMIGECLRDQAPFGIVRIKEDTLADLGCTAEIVGVTKKYEDGRMDIVAEGRRRFELVETDEERSFLRGDVLYIEDEPSSVAPGDVKQVVELHQEILQLFAAETPQLVEGTPASFQLAGALPLDLDFKQALLEMRSEAQRVTALIQYYERLLPSLRRAVKASKKAGGNGHV